MLMVVMVVRMAKVDFWRWRWIDRWMLDGQIRMRQW
jgi:hypothetical protein